MSVVYAEEDGSPIEKWGTNSALQARQVLRCNWGDRHALLAEVAADGPYNGGRDYPHYPGIGCLARAASITGFGQSTEYATGMNQYEDALVEVLYSTEGPTGVGAHRFLTEEMLPALDSRRLETGQMKWDSASGTHVLAGDSPSHQLGTIDYVLTFYELLAIPAAAYVLNVSNDAPVPAFLYPIVFPTETLRHLAPLMTRTVGIGLAIRYRLQYRWTFRDDTWAKFPDSSATFRSIFHTGNSALLKPYTPVDFSAMYPPP